MTNFTNSKKNLRNLRKLNCKIYHKNFIWKKNNTYSLAIGHWWLPPMYWGNFFYRIVITDVSEGYGKWTTLIAWLLDIGGCHQCIEETFFTGLWLQMSLKADLKVKKYYLNSRKISYRKKEKKSSIAKNSPPKSFLPSRYIRETTFVTLISITLVKISHPLVMIVLWKYLRKNSRIYETNV